MFKFSITENASLIKEVMTEKHCWQHISDDYSPAPEDFEPVFAASIMYIKCTDENEKVFAIFILLKFNNILAELHSAVLPVMAGLFKTALKELFNWVFLNTEYLRITTNVPAYNRLGFRAALESGMTEWGKNPESFMRHGKLVDQLALGISKRKVVN